MTEKRLDELADRVAKLEAPDTCAKGHEYFQGAGRAENVIFCRRCGATRQITDDAAMGFAP